MKFLITFISFNNEEKMKDNLEKIHKKLKDTKKLLKKAVKKNKRLEVELESVKQELKRERSNSSKEIGKRLLESRRIQHETGMRKGKKIKTHDRTGKVRVEGRPRLSEIKPDLAKRVIELHLKGGTLYGIANQVTKEGFRNTKDGKIYHSQVSTIIRDWKKGVFKTNIKLEPNHQLPKEIMKKPNPTLRRDKNNPNMIRALKESTGRLKQIVEMRIKQEMTLVEIGAHFNISRERVRQILVALRNGDSKTFNKMNK